MSSLYHLLIQRREQGVLLLPYNGVPASSHDFRWLDSAFTHRIHFFRLDLPGFGGSQAGKPRDPDFDTMGMSVAEFCEVLELEDVLVLGHSLGGAIALDAATRSHRITALALVNSPGQTVHRGLSPWFYRFLVFLIDLHPLLRRVILAVGKPIMHLIGFSKFLSDEELIFAARLARRFQPSVFRTQLNSLKKPIFIAWSSHDPAVKSSVSKAMIECAHSPETLCIQSKTHNLQSSHATELADAIIAWATKSSTNPKQNG